MAELNDSGGGKKDGGKVRSKKANARVDLTAMVDLAFLLITFFMLTTTLSKPQSMNLALPDKEDKKDDKTEDIKVDERRTITLILGKDNKITWFRGLVDTPFDGPSPQTYGKDGLRKVLLKFVKEVPEVMQDPKKGLIVIIKPTDKSTYRNVVDILDEMAICKVPTYAIVNDLDGKEKTIAAELNK